MQEQNRGARAFSGTLMAVLWAGDKDTPWRGLVHPTDEDSPVCLVLPGSPGDIRPGDDIHLDEVRRFRGQGDGRHFPDEVHGPGLWAAPTAPEQGAVFEMSHAQSPARGPGEMPGRLGLATLAAVAGSVQGDLRPAGGPLVVTRGQPSLDPALAWVQERFSDPATRHLRAPVTLMLDPAALLPSNVTQGRTRWLGGLRSALWPGRQDADLEADRVARIDRIARSLPTMLSSRTRHVTSTGFSRSAAFHSGLTQVPEAEGRKPDWFAVVSPYGAFDCSHSQWGHMTGLAGKLVMPRDFIPTDARNKLTAAHEAAHGYNAALGHAQDDILGKECFADAVAVMSYVAATGDLASGQLWADMRSIATFFGSPTHATGPACLAALQEAQALRQQYAGGAVPLAIILERADAIRRETTHPEPQDLWLLRGYVDAILAEPEPQDWWLLRGFADAILADPSQPQGALSSAGLARELDIWLARTDKLRQPEHTLLMMKQAIRALNRVAYDSVDLGNPATLLRAVDVHAADLADTARHMRSTGLAALVPEMLQRTQQSSRRPSPPPAADQADAVTRKETSSLSGALWQRARSAAAGGVSRLFGGAAPEHVAGDLQRAMTLAARRVALHHAILGTPATGPMQRLPVITGGVAAPSGAGFALAVPERLRQAGLAFRSLTEVGAEGVVQPDAAVRALCALAWTVRVDHVAWERMCRSGDAAVLRRWEQVARMTPEGVALLQSPAAAQELGTLVDDTLQGRLAPPVAVMPSSNPAWERLCAAKVRAAMRQEELQAGGRDAAECPGSSPGSSPGRP